jgi:hypothetical protein
MSRPTLSCLAVVSLLIPLSACAAQPPVAAAPRDARAAAAIVEAKERQLLQSLVRYNRAGANGILADDFTCTVTGNHPFTLGTVQARFSVCTGLGHETLGRTEPNEAIRVREDRLPRVGEILSMSSSEENGAIVVVSTQSYQRWQPYDATFVRRSRLTDTWMLRDGDWRLVRRISDPLPDTAANSRGRS